MHVCLPDLSACDRVKPVGPLRSKQTASRKKPKPSPAMPPPTPTLADPALSGSGAQDAHADVHMADLPEPSPGSSLAAAIAAGKAAILDHDDAEASAKDASVMIKKEPVDPANLEGSTPICILGQHVDLI